MWITPTYPPPQPQPPQLPQPPPFTPTRYWWIRRRLFSIDAMETLSTLRAFYRGNTPVTVGFCHKGVSKVDLSYSVLLIWTNCWHYSDVIMGSIASQITSLTIVYSSVYSGADRRKQQSSVSLGFVRGFHRRSVNSLHKGPVTRKMFPFDDVIMKSEQLWYGHIMAIIKR